MKRPKHPHKEIEKVIQYSESLGWVYKKAGRSAHAWGRLVCPHAAREGCSLSVWSSPRNPEKHTQQILNRVRRCSHQNHKGKL